MTGETAIGVSRSRFVLFAIFLGLAAPMVSGCEEVFDGPTIVDMTVTPSEIPETDTGMTDESFRVEILTSGFNSQIEDAVVFIQRPTAEDRDAPYDKGMYPEVEGNRVIIDGIDKTWFQGLGPGRYDIGATVESPEADITERNLADVTVTSSGGGS